MDVAGGMQQTEAIDDRLVLILASQLKLHYWIFKARNELSDPTQEKMEPQKTFELQLYPKPVLLKVVVHRLELFTSHQL